MHTAESIQGTVKQSLPSLFGPSGSDDHVFSGRFDAMLEYATSATKPFMSSETVRYQSILLYVSLVFASISFFRIEFVTPLPGPSRAVATDTALRVVYTIFLAAVSTIFLLKAYLDYVRVSFIPPKTVSSVERVVDLFRMDALKRQLHLHFWLELSDSINAAYNTFAQSAAQLLKRETALSVPRFEAVSQLDLGKLRQIPELAIEVAVLESQLDTLRSLLATDQAAFIAQADALLSKADASEDPSVEEWEKPTTPTVYAELKAAQDRFLSHWFEAKRDLAAEQLAWATNPVRQDDDQKTLEKVRQTLEKIRRVRLLYARLELWAPVAFAAVVVAFVWLNSR